MDRWLSPSRALTCLITIEAVFFASLCFPERFLGLIQRIAARLPLFDGPGGGYLLASLLVLLGCVILPLLIAGSFLTGRSRALERRRRAELL